MIMVLCVSRVSVDVCKVGRGGEGSLRQLPAQFLLTYLLHVP